MRPARPAEPLWDNIPKKLTVLPQWAGWLYVCKDGRWTKLLVQPDGTPAKVNDPTTWTSFEDCQCSYLSAPNGKVLLDGVGCVLSISDTFCAFDFDHCRNPDTGQIDPTIADYIRRLDSYSEVSPSSRGIRIIVEAKLPARDRRLGDIEMYDSLRFITLTGQVLPSSPLTVERRQEVVEAIHSEVFAERISKRHGHSSNGSASKTGLSLSDSQLLDKARTAKNGTRFAALFDYGDISGFSSSSEADFSLCSRLHFWLGDDPERIARLWRSSALSRGKLNRADYVERTIAAALEAGGATYSGANMGNGNNGSSKRAGGVNHDARSNPKASNLPPPPPRTWAKLAKEALHGIAGDFVKLVAPQTEADPAALLFQFLVIVGNMVGRIRCRTPDRGRHWMNLFVLVVGTSSKARKGTALARVLSLIERVDKEWTVKNIVSGLSSGEGLIFAVRDARKAATKKDKDDPGVSDKRLLAVQSEFVSVLKVMKREGNTLSDTLRLAFDSGNLAILVKNAPDRATGAHVSITGHITTGELQSYLDDVEMINGFANRFLFCSARRSKILPCSDEVDGQALEEIANRVRKALEETRKVAELKFGDAALDQWKTLYSALSAEREDGIGSITARAEALVCRIAFIYATLDAKEEVQPEHLKAALAVWDYSVASVEHIFTAPDKVADAILAALRTNSNGLTRTEISSLFNNNEKAERINTALEDLQQRDLAEPSIVQTAGRPAERWFAVVRDSEATTPG